MAESMSDGTLRALGVLTALFQATLRNGSHVPLVGIEEPEMAVHPGAAGVLRDALKVASASTQVVVTSHSPDLLDDKEVVADWILGVVSENGETKIGPIDEADRSVIRDRLFTAGELLRQGQLLPDRKHLKPDSPGQLELFGRQDL
jgi:predicted ATPase